MKSLPSAVLAILLATTVVAQAATRPSTGNGSTNAVCDSTAANCAQVTSNGAAKVSAYVGSNDGTVAVACDKSTPVAITSAVSTLVASAVAGQSIYVCGWVIDKASGSGTTFQFVYGTTVTTQCDTGRTILTGPMDGAAGWTIAGGAIGILFSAPASKALCIISVGGSSDFEGVLTYVQF